MRRDSSAFARVTVHRRYGAGLDLVLAVGQKLLRAGHGILADADVLVQARQVPIQPHHTGNGRNHLLSKHIVGDLQVVLRDPDVSPIHRRPESAQQRLREGEPEAGSRGRIEVQQRIVDAAAACCSIRLSTDPPVANPCFSPKLATVVLAFNDRRFERNALFCGSEVWFQPTLPTSVGSKLGTAGPVERGSDPMMERSVCTPGPVSALSAGVFPPPSVPSGPAAGPPSPAGAFAHRKGNAAQRAAGLATKKIGFRQPRRVAHQFQIQIVLQRQRDGVFERQGDMAVAQKRVEPRGYSRGEPAQPPAMR